MDNPTMGTHEHDSAVVKFDDHSKFGLIDLIARSRGPWEIQKVDDYWMVFRSGGLALVRKTHAAACSARDRENLNWAKQTVAEAAEDMFAALHAISEHTLAVKFSKSERLDKIYDAARAAIAKATGAA